MLRARTLLSALLLAGLILSMVVCRSNDVLADEPDADLRQRYVAAEKAYNSQQFSTVLELAQAGLVEAQQRNNLQYAALFLNYEGLAQESLGRYAEALASHQQALALDRQLGNRPGEASDLRNSGIVYFDLGRDAEALASSQGALALDRQLGNRLGEAQDLSKIGAVYGDLGRNAEALASLQQTVVLDRQLGNRLGEASVLCNIGIVYDDLGRYAEALTSHQQALALDRQLGNRFGEANVLGSIGNVYHHQGRYPEALDFYQRALALHRQLGNRLGEAADLGNNGIVCDDLGRYEEALAFLQQALALFRQLGKRDGEAYAVGSIGNVYRDQGRYPEALDSYQRALALAREIGNLYSEAQSLAGIGNVDAEQGSFNEALASHQQALALERQLGNQLDEVTELQNIGNVYERLGRYADALPIHQQSLALGRQLGTLDIWRTLCGLAIDEIKLNRQTDALTYFEAAADRIEALRGELSDESNRRSFFETKLAVYDLYIAYLLELNLRFPGKGHDRKALEIFERKSARAVLEQVGESAAQHFRGVPADVVASEREAGVAADRAQSTLSKLLSTTGSDQTAIASAEQNLAAAKARVATLDASIKAQYPAYYELRHPQPLAAQCQQPPCPTIAGFQQSVLRPGEVMLVYDLLEKQSALWLIDRDRVQLLPLAGSADIARAVKQLRAHVAKVAQAGYAGTAQLERGAADDLPKFASDSHALYQLLVPDTAAAAIARAKNLIVVPSGALYGLAFETLVSRDPSAAPQPHYLIEDLPISYIPSASLLSVVRTSYAQAIGAPSLLLAFANPAFGADQPGAARGLSRYASLQLAAARSAFRDGPGAVAIGEADFPPLPGTQTEAAAVRAALDAPAASLVTGDAATRRRVLDLNATDSLKAYRYVLFATHAVLPNEIKGLTQPAIVLAHPERGDGLLTMADVFGLTLDADFVTLSACSTGVAEGEASGEGISGLTRAFLYAGTPAISVTLWEVYDEAAPRITPAFFAGMHGGKLTAAESLQNAKLAMLKSPEARFRHPYAWAPSVIFGDGNRREAAKASADSPR